jgi:hypothetical protein
VDGRRGKSPTADGGLTNRQYQLLFLRYFPGMTPDFVENGPDGNGIPWDWWTFGCDLIDEWFKRGV